MKERRYSSMCFEFEANTLLPFNLNPNTESCIIYLKICAPVGHTEIQVYPLNFQ